MKKSDKMRALMAEASKAPAKKKKKAKKIEKDMMVDSSEAKAPEIIEKEEKVEKRRIKKK